MHLNRWGLPSALQLEIGQQRGQRPEQAIQRWALRQPQACLQPGGDQRHED